MWKTELLLLTIAASITCSTCQNDEPSILVQQEVANSTQFSIEFYQQCFDETANTVVSPLSFRILLAIIYQGALNNSTSEKELQEILHFNSDKESASRAQVAVLDFHSQNPSIKLFNKIYLSRRDTLLDQFRKVVRKHKAELQRVNFNKPKKTANNINNWASRKTNGLITNLVSDGTITSDTVLFLISTLYFKADWEDPFDVELLSKPFYGYNGNDYTASYMKNSQADIEYARCDYIKSEVFQLFYTEDTINRFWVVFPYADSNITEVKDLLSYDKLSQIKKDLQYQLADLELPKFEIESEIDGKEHFETLGVQSIFNEDELKMVEGRNLYVSEIKQKSKIIVNTKGTEAAAVSYGKISDRMMTYPKRHDVNRPFIYIIVCAKTNDIIFMGHYVKP